MTGIAATLVHDRERHGFAGLGDRVRFCISGLDPGMWTAANAVGAVTAMRKNVSAAFAGLFSATLLSAGLLLTAGPAASAGDQQKQGFDFYVLSLSWSPFMVRHASAGAEDHAMRSVEGFRLHRSRAVAAE